MLRSLTVNDRAHLEAELKAIDVETAGIDIMLPKGEFYVLKTDPISSPAANILKQQMLSVGGECAVSREVATCRVDQCPVILMGTRTHFVKLIDSLTYQYFGLKVLRKELQDFLNRKQTWIVEIGSQRFDLARKTLIMGILNVTPDSFSDGGQYRTAESAIKAGLKMITSGADIIDVGGESTRPGAKPVPLEEELERVLPVIKGIRKQSDCPLSIDTYKSQVAKAAIEDGADMVNDISGLNFDNKMPGILAQTQVSAVLMHIQGKPKNMQQNPHYENLIDEIIDYLQTGIEKATAAGVPREQLWIDPGIGFGKKWYQNYIILRYLDELKSLSVPVLVGPSRKSFLGKLSDLSPQERLEGTLAALSCAVLNGANMVRVHDVSQAVKAVEIADAIAGKL